MAHLPIMFYKVNEFRNEHMTREFTADVNPNQTVPCLKRGPILVLSLRDIIMTLQTNSERASELFRHPDQQDDELLTFYIQTFQRHGEAVKSLAGVDLT